MRVSLDGTRYVYTNRVAGPTITLVTPLATTPLGAGQDARWRGDQVWWRPQEDGPLCFASGPHWALERSALASGNSLAVGGTQTAVHRTDPVRIIEDGYELARGYSWPVYSDEGAILAALRPDYPHPQMQSIELFGPGASRRTLYQGSVIDGTQGSDFRMAGTTLCFREASGYVFGVIDVGNQTLRPEVLARPGEGVSHACPVFVPARGLYVLHVRSSGGGTGRVCLASWPSMLAGTPMGWVLDESGGGGYEHDARVTATQDTTVLVAWTRPDGTASHRWLDLRTAVGPLLSHTPRSPFGVRVEDPKALGYFYERGPRGTFHPKRNCTITSSHLWKQDEDGDGDQELPADIDVQLASAIDDAGTAFLAADLEDYRRPIIQARWSKILGVWTHEPDSPDMAREWVAVARNHIKIAGLPPRPVITVLVEGQTLNAGYNGVGDALAPEIYFERPEATYEAQLAVARTRIANVCTAFSLSPLYLCIQAFNRIAGGTAWKDAPWALEALQQAGNEALTRPQVRGLWWFAYGRVGGTVDYPQLEYWHAAQVAVTRPPPRIVDPTPKPPVGDDMTADEIRRYVAELNDTVLFGAVQRFHNEVLPRDRPLDGAIKSAAWTAGDLDFWTGDVTTGGANGYFCRAYIPEYLIARSKGRSVDDASGDGYDKAIAAYRKATNPQ